MYSARRFAVLACPLLMVSVVACTPGASAQDGKPPSSAPSSGSSDGKKGGLPLAEAIGRLKVARASRDGYQRDKFHLWTDADHDGCEIKALCAAVGGCNSARVTFRPAA